MFQHAALTQHLPFTEGLALHAVYAAAERDAEVGGDWYDAFPLEDGRLVISLGDVAGKGLQGAVIMSGVRQAIRVVALKGFSPAQILEASSLALESEHPDTTVTAFVGIIAPKEETICYASAGHPPPLLRLPNGDSSFLPLAVSPPLGLLHEMPKNHICSQLAPNSLLVLYSDGLTESTRDVFEGEKRLLRAVAHENILESSDPAKFIYETVLYDGVSDDVAILTVGFGSVSTSEKPEREALGFSA